MLIATTAAILISVGIGAFVLLLAATAMARRAIDLDGGLEEQPIENWELNSGQPTLSTHMTAR